MALDVRQNFFSTQYLENKLTYFHQILYMHWYWQVLAWHCYVSFFQNLYQSYGPWFTTKFHFYSISWEQIHIFSPNFIYALILTSSSLALLNVIFPKFVPELWPLVYAKISFLLKILRTNRHIFTKFYICIDIDKFYLGIVKCRFSKICTRVMALGLRQNFIPTQYLENNGHIFTKFYICIDIDKF